MPCELAMKMWEKKRREICQLIVDRKISISLAKSMLKTMCLSDEAMSLIVDLAIIKHALENSNMDLHDLSRFHKLIDYSNLHFQTLQCVVEKI